MKTNKTNKRIRKIERRGQRDSDLSSQDSSLDNGQRQSFYESGRGMDQNERRRLISRGAGEGMKDDYRDDNFDTENSDRNQDMNEEYHTSAERERPYRNRKR